MLYNPTLNIARSQNGNFELEIKKSARGFDKKEASATARKIFYSIRQQDSLLTFSPSYSFMKADRWRKQDVELTLKVPEGKVIYLGKNTEHIIYDIQNTTNTIDEDMAGKYWQMTAGGLKCMRCN